MELYEAINGRRSIRAYNADPVPRAVLEKILDDGSVFGYERIAQP